MQTMAMVRFIILIYHIVIVPCITWYYMILHCIALYSTRNLGARWAQIASWWPSATLLALRACLCNKTYLSRPSGTQSVFCCI